MNSYAEKVRKHRVGGPKKFRRSKHGYPPRTRTKHRGAK